MYAITTTAVFDDRNEDDIANIHRVVATTTKKIKINVNIKKMTNSKSETIQISIKK